MKVGHVIFECRVINHHPQRLIVYVGSDKAKPLVNFKTLYLGHLWSKQFGESGRMNCFISIKTKNISNKILNNSMNLINSCY